MLDYGNFQKSLKNLEVQNQRHKDMDKEWPEWSKEGIAESVIRRFKICHDCLWKILNKHIKETEDVTENLDSPRRVFRRAAQLGLFSSSLDRWFQYTKARMDTTHDYSGEKAQNAIGLMDDFINDAIELYRTMTNETWHSRRPCRVARFTGG